MSNFVIEDGGGGGNRAIVDEGNRLLTRAVFEPEIDYQSDSGNSYNFNTGAPFDIGANNSSAVVFMKNTDQIYNLVVTAFIYNLGIAASGLTDGTEFTNIVVVRNPTAISSSTAVVPVNRNHGSTNLLNGTFSKGAGGATFTGGNDMIETLIAGVTGGRSFISVGSVILKPNNSIGVRYEAHATTSQQYVQFAASMYLDKES
jgi:hypothetical protein